MFGYLYAPRASYNYYKPRFYYQRHVPNESYLFKLIKDQAHEYEKIKSIIYKTMIEQQKEIYDNNEKTLYNINVEKKENQKDEEKRTMKEKSFYYFERHSKFDGKKIVEEQKERKIDSEGKIHQILKRRLGDKWYQTEQIKDEQGKTTVKESWHNVSENEVDNFKQEWINQIDYQHKLSQDTDINKSAESPTDKIEAETLNKTEIDAGSTKNDIALSEDKSENTLDEKEKKEVENNESNNDALKEKKEENQIEACHLNDVETNSD